MNDKTKESLRIILPVIIMFWFSSVVYGQVQTPPAERIIESPPVEKPTLNTVRVGIVPASFQPKIRFDKPMTRGKATLHGAGVGAGLPPVYGLYRYGPGGLICGLFLSPVGAVVGSVVGVSKGSSAKEIQEGEDALQEYLATLNFQETMREHLVSAASDQTQYSFVPLEVQGPLTPDEEVAYDVSTYQDIDAVLEFGVSQCRLEGQSDGINPDLQLIMRGKIQFFNAKDGKLYDGPFLHFSSIKQEFADWSTDNAKLFKEELGRGLQSLSEQIIKSFIFCVNFSAESSEAMKTEER